LLALLLAMVMTVSMVPVQAFAAEVDAPENETTLIAGENSEEPEDKPTPEVPPEDGSEQEDLPEDGSEQEDLPEDGSEQEDLPEDGSEQEDLPEDGSEQEDLPENTDSPRLTVTINGIPVADGEPWELMVNHPVTIAYAVDPASDADRFTVVPSNTEYICAESVTQSSASVTATKVPPAGTELYLTVSCFHCEQDLYWNIPITIVPCRDQIRYASPMLTDFTLKLDETLPLSACLNDSEEVNAGLYWEVVSGNVSISADNVLSAAEGAKPAQKATIRVSQDEASVAEGHQLAEPVEFSITLTGKPTVVVYDDDHDQPVVLEELELYVGEEKQILLCAYDENGQQIEGAAFRSDSDLLVLKDNMNSFQAPTEVPDPDTITVTITASVTDTDHGTVIPVAEGEIRIQILPKEQDETTTPDAAKNDVDIDSTRHVEIVTPEDQTNIVLRPGASIPVAAVVYVGENATNEPVQWNVTGTDENAVDFARVEDGKLKIDADKDIQASQLLTITATEDSGEFDCFQVTVIPKVNLVVKEGTGEEAPDARESYSFNSNGTTQTLTLRAYDSTSQEGTPKVSWTKTTLPKGVTLTIDKVLGTATITIKPKCSGSFKLTVTSLEDSTAKVVIPVTVTYAPAELSFTNLPDTIVMGSKPLAIKLSGIEKGMKNTAVTWSIRLRDTTDFSQENNTDLTPFYASITNKGVLTTYIVPFSDYSLLVTATLNSNPEVKAEKVVQVIPPVESIDAYVFPEYMIGPKSTYSIGSAVNRNDKQRYWECDIADGALLLLAQVTPYGASSDLNLSVQVSPKGAASAPELLDISEVQENLCLYRITPNAPCKITFTFSSKDGSGAKYTGVINVVGCSQSLNITTQVPEEPLKPGSTLKLTAEAFYDEDATPSLKVANPKIKWDVGLAVEDDEGYYPAPDGITYSFADTNLATIKNNTLTISNKVRQNCKLILEAYDANGDWEAYDYLLIDVAPSGSNAKSLALAIEDSDGKLFSSNSKSVEFNPDKPMKLMACWLSSDGTLEKITEGVTYTPSKNASYDPATGLLTPKSTGTVTLKASVRNGTKTVTVTETFQSAYKSKYVRLANETQEVIFKGKTYQAIVVTGGQTITLKPESMYSIQGVDGAEKDQLATVQEFDWFFPDDYHDITSFNRKTYKLTTRDITEAELHRIACFNSGFEDQRIYYLLILPADKTYITVFGDAVPSIYARNDGSTIPVSQVALAAFRNSEKYTANVTDITVSDKTGKIAKIERDENGKPTAIVFPGKTGTVTFTATASFSGGESDDFTATAKATIKIVNKVSNITINRPTDKQGSPLPLYVGKTLKLTASVDSGEKGVVPTNKQVIWHIAREEDGSLYEGDELYWLFGDKTTIKNGVISVDKSYDIASRVYYVWAEAADGLGSVSEKTEIRAYSKANHIAVTAYNSVGNGYPANNQVLNIETNETFIFGAEIVGALYDYDQGDGYGYGGAHQNVKWTVSGKSGTVKTWTDRDGYGDNYQDQLLLTGLKPGTVTIKATTLDGSNKSVTFKVVVSEAQVSSPQANN
ncbi:MAG: hypothetical protein PUF71_02395, partial [Firmicutes bacterium]|nr:hypothetical protein [Bacillota bacterium]